jgi:hypothetical protein
MRGRRIKPRRKVTGNKDANDDFIVDDNTVEYDTDASFHDESEASDFETDEDDPDFVSDDEQ